MNCHTAQNKITDALADQVVLPPDVAWHRGNCVACQAFYERQHQLFAAMDAALVNAVNEPVPLSFLLRLRAQLDQAAAPRSLCIPRWTYAALAAAMLFLTVLGFRSHPPRHDSNSRSNRVIARTDHGPAPEPPPISTETAHPYDAAVRAEKKASPGFAQPSEAVPPVIVLAEEQHAYARFVASGRQAPGLRSALNPATPEQTDAPIDIALIEIQDVEIARLDSINGDGQ